MIYKLESTWGDVHGEREKKKKRQEFASSGKGAEKGWGEIFAGGGRDVKKSRTFIAQYGQGLDSRRTCLSNADFDEARKLSYVVEWEKHEENLILRNDAKYTLERA